MVVLVHGSLDRAGSFARVMRRLDDLHTVAYDRRGYHRSRHVTPVHDTLDGHVGDLLAVIDGRPCVVVGHSYGGDVVLGAALRPGGPGPILAVAAYEPPMPWLGPSATRPRAGGAGDPRPEDEDPAEVAERFFRRMVGDSAWDRLPEETQEARRRRRARPGRRDRRHPHDGGAVRRQPPGRAGRLRARHRLPPPPAGLGGLAGSPRPGRRAGRDRRRGTRRPPDPPRRIRPIRPAPRWHVPPARVPVDRRHAPPRHGLVGSHRHRAGRRRDRPGRHRHPTGPSVVDTGRRRTSRRRHRRHVGPGRRARRPRRA